MKRWAPMAAVVAALFVVNLAGRVVTRLFLDDDDLSGQTMVGVIGAIAMGVVALLAGIRWSATGPVQRTVAQLGSALLVATVLCVLPAPLVVGGNPFGGGVGLVFAELFMFAVITIGAALLGMLITMALGIDHRSRQLKRVEHHYGRGRR